MGIALWLERIGLRRKASAPASTAGEALRQLKDRAATSQEGRRFAEAAELYLRLARLQPGQPEWQHRAGEALLRAGARARAVEQLVSAAEAYAWRGFYGKARAVARAALAVHPAHPSMTSLLDCLDAMPRGRSDEPTVELPPKGNAHRLAR